MVKSGIIKYGSDAINSPELVIPIGQDVTSSRIC